MWVNKIFSPVILLIVKTYFNTKKKLSQIFEWWLQIAGVGIMTGNYKAWKIIMFLTLLKTQYKITKMIFGFNFVVVTLKAKNELINIWMIKNLFFMVDNIFEIKIGNYFSRTNPFFINFYCRKMNWILYVF